MLLPASQVYFRAVHLVWGSSEALIGEVSNGGRRGTEMLVVNTHTVGELGHLSSLCVGDACVCLVCVDDGEPGHLSSLCVCVRVHVCMCVGGVCVCLMCVYVCAWCTSVRGVCICV